MQQSGWNHRMESVFLKRSKLVGSGSGLWSGLQILAGEKTFIISRRAVTPAPKPCSDCLPLFGFRSAAKVHEISHNFLSSHPINGASLKLNVSEKKTIEERLALVWSVFNIDSKARYHFFFVNAFRAIHSWDSMIFLMEVVQMVEKFSGRGMEERAEGKRRPGVKPRESPANTSYTLRLAVESILIVA